MIFVITTSTIFLLFTSYVIYVAFGAPSKQLEDPFDKHED